MKKIVTIILTLACLMLLAGSCSRKTIYQEKTEELLVPSLKSPSSYKPISFECTGEETLREQIQERLKYYSSDERLQYYYDRVESSRGYLEEAKADKELKDLVADYEERYNDAQKDLEKELRFVEFLKAQLDLEDEVLDNVVAKEFKLTYEAMNPMGVMISSFVVSRFNENDELVAMRQEDDKWTVLGKFFSIPGYYENF